MIAKWFRILCAVSIVLFTISSLSFSVLLPSSIQLDLGFGAPPMRNSLNDCTPPVTNNTRNSSAIVPSYHILCTTYHTRWKWGSYQIRCRDLKSWADKCAPQVQIHLHPLTGGGRMTDQVGFGGKLDGNCLTYNASMAVKWIFDDPHPRFGQLFLDVVDDYNIRHTHVPNNVQVITQNSQHANDIFPNRIHHVVEHWFNSYPNDMMSIEPAFEIPQVSERNTSETHPLKMATVWTNDNWPCPNFTHPKTEVDYQCIDENYLIRNWHPKYMNPKNSSILADRFQGILNNTQLGPGRLYYELFWMYDVLVIPVKRQNRFKLKYGNVQRAASQMRSGVPVLLEVFAEVVQDFMERYNYTCAFVTDPHNRTNNNTRNYWSFDEAVEAMKSPQLRRKCQSEGLRIVRDYSPSQIARKHLRALGYPGPFTC